MIRWCHDRWGVLFYGALKEPPTLIGRGHHDDWQPSYREEPPRALLFTTRKEARDWCTAKHAQYANRGDFVSMWRFRPVRVRETVVVKQ